MKIIIAGDLFIADDFRSQDLIDKSVIDLFETADYRIVNLEAPITEDNPKNKIIKTGPHLRMSSDTIMPYLHQLKIDAVTMANNHILDYGYKGVKDTFKELVDHKIKYIGAGNDLTEAKKPLSLHKDGMKIAILNFCENEWSIAEDDSPGANPMDIIDNTNQIREAKASHDKVIVIVHGGHEYYNLPSPRMQKQYRFYVDNGADAIVGHHTHCIGGYEIYKNVPIIYSLGNFLFTLPSKKDVWYEGLLTNLIIEKDKPIKFKIHPVKQQKNSLQTILLIDEEKDTLIEKVQELNSIIIKEELLQNKWEKYVQLITKQYLNSFSPIQFFGSRYLIHLVKKIGIDKWFMSKYQYRLILNLIRCEAHNDASKEILLKSLETLKRN